MLLVPVLAALLLDPRDERLREQFVGALEAHAPLSAGVGPLGVQAEGPFSINPRADADIDIDIEKQTSR